MRIKRKKMEKKFQNKKRCNNCGSRQIYLRLRSNDYVCRDCGYVETLKEEQIKNGRDE